MYVSYLVSIRHLSVLAHFCGYAGFPMLPELPFIERDECEALLKELKQFGAVQIQNGEVSVDIGLAFVLSAVASPKIIIKTKDETLGYCAKSICAAINNDAYAKNKYKITPFPNADELAEYLSGHNGEYLIYTHVGEKRPCHDINDLKNIISDVYKGEIG